MFYVQETLIDPYGEGRQHSCYVNAGMAGVPRATTMKLKIGKDVVAMESSLAVESSGTASGGGVKGSDSRDKKELYTEIKKNISFCFWFK